MSCTVPARRDLFEAMKMIVQTGRGQEQLPSMGCSIKMQTLRWNMALNIAQSEAPGVKSRHDALKK
jgi:hypothetical protein